jgi:hypothetical protein
MMNENRDGQNPEEDKILSWTITFLLIRAWKFAAVIVDVIGVSIEAIPSLADEFPVN